MKGLSVFGVGEKKSPVHGFCPDRVGWKDPLEKEMATHSSILAWEIPWTEEPTGLQSMGFKTVGHHRATDHTHTHTHTHTRHILH